MSKKVWILLIVSTLFLGSCAETQSTATKCPLAKKKTCSQVKKKECAKVKVCNKKKECPLTKKCDQKKTCGKKKKCCESKKKYCSKKCSAKKDVYPGWNLGIQAWSFHTGFTLFETIDKTSELGLGWIEAYPGQPLCSKYPDAKFDHTLSAELRKKTKCKLKKAGVTLVAYGVVPPDLNNEAQLREIFEFAKDMGVKNLGVEPADEAALDIFYKLCKEYNIKAGIHNHPAQRSWSVYHNPDKVLGLAKKYDGIIGVCADVGHWTRSGYDAVESLKKLEGHITYVHIKDVEAVESRSKPVPFGSGIVNVKAVLQELDRQGFKGPISIEYPKKDWAECLKDMKDSIYYFNREAKKLK